MTTAEIVIQNELGLHARASARLVKVASEFQSSVTLKRPDTSQIADGKSILGILLLAARKGTRLEVAVRGDDEQFALQAIIHLIESLFGEDK